MENNKLGFYPLGSRVLVEKYKEDKKDDYTTIGTLFVPTQKDANLEFKKNSGKVVALGSSYGTDPSLIGSPIRVGTYITFKNPHIVMSPDGTEYYLIHENNIELILDEVE